MSERKSKIQRSDRLKEPPVAGKWYLVPAILWNRNAPWNHPKSEEGILAQLQNTKGAKWWPVWGSKHSDDEHFNFPALHYHIDPRFLTKRHMTDCRHNRLGRTALQTVQASPLNHSGLKSGPPKPLLRRMRCTMVHAEWGFAGVGPVAALNESFKDQQCRSGKRGFVCPHRFFPLGSIEAVEGVVTYPLHGMRIDAATGRCLGNKTPSLSA